MRGYTERPNVISGAALNNGGQTQFSKEFPMGEGWYAMWLRFRIAITIGTGTGVPVEGILLYIKNILLRTDRGEILCNLPGRALFKIAAYKTGTVPNMSTLAAASATYIVSLPIFFADDNLIRPEDTILDTKRYSSVSLNVTLGTIADLSTTPGTATVATTMDAEILRSMGALPKGGEPLWHINYDMRPPVDANSTINVDLERSPDMSLKRLYVHSGTTGVAGVPWSGTNSDAVQNVVNIKDQNRFIEKDRFHPAILDQNKADAGLEALLSGVEVFDFVRDGSSLSALATGDKSLLQYTWTNQGGLPALSIVTPTAEAQRTLK